MGPYYGMGSSVRLRRSVRPVRNHKSIMEDHRNFRFGANVVRCIRRDHSLLMWILQSLISKTNNTTRRKCSKHFVSECTRPSGASLRDQTKFSVEATALHGELVFSIKNLLGWKREPMRGRESLKSAQWCLAVSDLEWVRTKAYMLMRQPVQIRMSWLN